MVYRLFLDECLSHLNEVECVKSAVFIKIAGLPVRKLSIGSAEQPLAQEHQIAGIELVISVDIADDLRRRSDYAIVKDICCIFEERILSALLFVFIINPSC